MNMACAQIFPRCFVVNALRFALALVAACLLPATSAEDTALPDERVVRVALPISTLRGMDPVDAQLTMNRIFDFVGINNVEFKSTVYSSTEEVYQAVIDERADMIPMLIEEFLQRPHDCKMDPVLQGVTDEVAGEQLVMLAPKGVQMADMKGQKFIIDEAQQMPRIWLDLLLADQGLPDDATFFSSVKEELRASDAVLPVFFGEAIGCITSREVFETLSELNPQLKQRLHVIAESAPYAMHVICLRSNYAGEKRDNIIADMSAMHKTSNGRQVLLLTRINRVDRCDPKLVEAASEMLKRWQSLKTISVTAGSSATKSGVEDSERAVAETATGGSGL